MAVDLSKLSLATVSLLMATAFAPIAGAQETDHAGHVGHDSPAQNPQALSDASKEYEAVNQTMHKGMTLPYSNDADLDFVRGMIPHHQGAIEQSKILLKYSTNPRLRRLALGIIFAQKREIAFMQKWLEVREKGGEMEIPDWLKNDVPPDGVRAPSVGK